MKQITTLADLSQDDRNANKGNPRGRGMVETSLQKYGAGRSVLVDRNGKLIAGNKTSEAAAAIGLDDVVVVQTDGRQLVVVQRTDLDLNEDTAARELAIADNRAGELGLEWDTDVLASLGNEIDLSSFWTRDEIAALLQEETPTSGGGDDAPDVQDGPTRVQPGELWQLGRHRLLCGDSTKREDVERLMQGERADMVLTDPPYGMDLDTDWSDAVGQLTSTTRQHQTKGNVYARVVGDAEPFDPTHIFDLFGYCKEVFLFGADYYAERIPARTDGSWLVWDKRKESQADAIGAEFELCWSKGKHKRRMLRHDWFGFLSSGNSKEAQHREHPTQKPTSLLIDIMQQWGKVGDVVADLYGGSGTIVVACERTNRSARVCEIEPRYCDVILKRWENETGTHAERID